MLSTAGDRLIELEQSLPLVGVALEARRLGFALEKAVSAIEKFDYQLRRFEALTRTAEMLGTHLGASEKDVQEAIEEAQDLGEFMSRADDQVRLDTVARDFPNLEREINRFHRAVASMADRFVTDNYLPLTALGDLLVRIGQENLGSKLKQIETQARDAIRGSVLDLPLKLGALQAQGTKLKGELNDLAKDPEVNAFLLTLGKGHASLRVVTPAVLRWLGEQDALEQFRVVSA